MTIEKVRDFFGIKYVIPYDLDTKLPFCVLRAVGEISYENEVEAVELGGGHTEAPYDVEYGQPSPTLKGTLREYPAELFQLMETATVTENSAETSGSVDSPTNAQGTSIIAGANGVSGIAVSSANKANLMFGRYVLKATGPTTLSLYLAGLTDSFLDIEGNIVASISTTGAGTVTVTAAGIELTVVGTPNYTTGDTAYFDVRPVNTGSTEVLVGAGTAPTNFGVICVFPRKTDGVLHYIDVFNVSGRGMPWKGVSREFSEFEFAWKPTARASDGAVYQMVRCLGS